MSEQVAIPESDVLDEMMAQDIHDAIAKRSPGVRAADEYEARLEDCKVKTLKALLNLYRKWLYLEETEDIEVILACLLDREIPGDPIWLQVIAPSGEKKTEILRSFRDYSKAYTLDSLTTKTLVSGLTRTNKESGEPEPAAGLLPKINGKTLIIKDFSTTLGKSEEYRTEFYSQLRSIYDGYFEAGYGTLPEPIRVPCEIGLIAAATPAIDRYNRLENSLGTRFVKIRSDSDAEKATKKALENAPHVDEMRFQLRNAVRFYTEALRDRGAFKDEDIPQLTEDQKNLVIAISLYVSKMRASVWAKFDRSGDILTLDASDVEKPTRVAKQFMRLAQLLAIIREHPIGAEEIKTIQRVARNTAEPTRQVIMDAFNEHGGFNAALTIQDIEGITRRMGNRIHYRTARNELEVMETLGVVDRDDEGAYKVNEEFRELALYAYVYPGVASEKKPDLISFSEVTRGEGVYLEFAWCARQVLKAAGGNMGKMGFEDEMARRFGYHRKDTPNLIKPLIDRGLVMEKKDTYTIGEDALWERSLRED